jgi:hypothetical protein
LSGAIPTNLGNMPVEIVAVWLEPGDFAHGRKSTTSRASGSPKLLLLIDVWAAYRLLSDNRPRLASSTFGLGKAGPANCFVNRNQRARRVIKGHTRFAVVRCRL